MVTAVQSSCLTASIVPAQEKKLDFILGGVQKSGTTALSRYLEDLPGVHLQSTEIHFFDDEVGVDWSAPDYGAYHRRVGGSDQVLRGDSTPIYLYWPNSLERIRAYAPDIRLVFIFRDPIERAWSQWRMEYARGLETQSFAWCVRQGRERLAYSETPGFHRVRSYVERGFYGSQVEHLLGLFSPDQVLFLRSEDLEQEAGRVLTQVCDFIGAPAPVGPITPRRERVGAQIGRAAMTSEDISLLRRIFDPEMEAFTDLTGLQVARWRR